MELSPEGVPAALVPGPAGGEIVSREMLLEELWDHTGVRHDNTLTVNVTRVPPAEDTGARRGDLRRSVARATWLNPWWGVRCLSGSFSGPGSNYIVVYVAFAVLALLVVHLDLMFLGPGWQFANLAYICSRGLAGLVLYLSLGVSAGSPLLPPPGRADGQGAHSRSSPCCPPRRRARAAPGRGLEPHVRPAERRTGRRTGAGQKNVSLVTQWAHHMKTPVSVVDLLLQWAQPDGWPEEAMGPGGQRGGGEPAAPAFAADAAEHRAPSGLRRGPACRAAGPGGLCVRRVVNDQKREFIAWRVYPQVRLRGFRATLACGERPQVAALRAGAGAEQRPEVS